MTNQKPGQISKLISVYFLHEQMEKRPFIQSFPPAIPGQVKICDTHKLTHKPPQRVDGRAGRLGLALSLAGLPAPLLCFQFFTHWFWRLNVGMKKRSKAQKHHLARSGCCVLLPQRQLLKYDKIYKTNKLRLKSVGHCAVHY